MNLKIFGVSICDSAFAISKTFIILCKLFRFILFIINSEEKFDVTDVTSFVTDVTLYEIYNFIALKH